MGEHDYAKREVITEPAGEHFKKRGHTVAELKGQVIEKVKSKDPLILKRAKESMLIILFDSLRQGLDKEQALSFLFGKEMCMIISSLCQKPTQLKFQSPTLLFSIRTVYAFLSSEIQRIFGM